MTPSKTHGRPVVCSTSRRQRPSEVGPPASARPGFLLLNPNFLDNLFIKHCGVKTHLETHTHRHTHWLGGVCAKPLRRWWWWWWWVSLALYAAAQMLVPLNWRARTITRAHISATRRPHLCGVSLCRTHAQACTHLHELALNWFKADTPLVLKQHLTCIIYPVI